MSRSVVHPALFEGLEERFSHAVVVATDPDGYPMSVAAEFHHDAARGVIVLGTFRPEPPVGSEVNVVFSHIRPQPGQGYDERRYVQVWGTLRREGDRLEVTPERAQGWDEQDMPFFEFSERGVPQARRYMDRLARDTGRTVKPRLSTGWLILRATRLPFLSATFIPVALGVAAAALEGRFTWWLALLTLLGGSFVHLGLNVANDVFDTASGADAANVTPTQFSGGSRVIHYGLVSLRGMALLSAALYLAGIAIGLFLAVYLESVPLLLLGLAGVVISLAYTAPPFRLVHRGVGEVAVALGFGPIMLLGAYYVQTERFTFEAGFLSIPVAILIALVLYVNEIPDRAGDGAAGKGTLPVRWSKDAVIQAYVASVAVAFGLIAVGAVTGILAGPALIALGALPLAFTVVRGLRDHYDSPYQLMAFMGKNIQLHFLTGVLLLIGYVVAIVIDRNVADPPAFFI
jgi:1,4-dihydroxy-2-naphthoate polyprenyltransferase